MNPVYKDSVALLGDSLTCGQEVPNNIVSRFNAAYTRTLDVVNRGIHGYNTSWYLPYMERMFAKHDPTEVQTASNVRLVVIWFGCNDALSPENAPDRGVPLSQFKENMNKILELLTTPAKSDLAVAHSTCSLSIILIAPSCIHEPMLKASVLTNERLGEYRDAVLTVGADWKAKETGQRWKIGTIDYYQALERAISQIDDPTQLYTDGIHLSSKGYDILWTEIERLIATDFQGRGIDWKNSRDLPWTATKWEELLESEKLKHNGGKVGNE